MKEFIFGFRNEYFWHIARSWPPLTTVQFRFYFLFSSRAHHVFVLSILSLKSSDVSPCHMSHAATESTESSPACFSGINFYKALCRGVNHPLLAFAKSSSWILGLFIALLHERFSYRHILPLELGDLVSSSVTAALRRSRPLSCPLWR